MVWYGTLKLRRSKPDRSLGAGREAQHGDSWSWPGTLGLSLTSAGDVWRCVSTSLSSTSCTIWPGCRAKSQWTRARWTTLHRTEAQWTRRRKTHPVHTQVLHELVGQIVQWIVFCLFVCLCFFFLGGGGRGQGKGSKGLGAVSCCQIEVLLVELLSGELQCVPRLNNPDYKKKKNQKKKKKPSKQTNKKPQTQLCIC